MSSESERPAAYAWYALTLLTAVYVLNFLDRTLIYILFTPIKKEMAFSDLQLALLGTTSFVIFYTLLGVPFGWLADRVPRKVIIGAGLAVWSLFSGLTGFAHTFWSIFFCRMMVGVGEATLGPAALSLLSDYFPPRMRATSQSIYSSGIAIGGGLAFFLGGWIGQSYGWRWAFYLLGFPGLVLAALLFGLREPPRGRTDAAAAPAADWRLLFRSAPLLYLFAGYALVGLASNNLSIWGTAFYIRMHGVSLKQVGTGAGVFALAIGAPAMIASGWFADRVKRRMAFTAAAALISVPLWIALILLPSLVTVVVANVFVYALAILWVGPATADVTEIAGPRLRGLAIGVFFSIVNITAYAVGSTVIGKLSDVWGLRNALLVCPVACAGGALLLWLGSK
ncbi:MAG TPA: MFS transporter, partial [Thermoanaerobaculia bacterium]|nr:MFS transporter [Thermoanaerobaculia bacterium]